MRTRPAVVFVVCFVSAICIGVGPSQALSAEPTAVVALGDSYASGEGGRWQGNHDADWGDRRGTDRAAVRARWIWRYDPTIVYGASYSTGCHRSDVAPIVSAALDADAVLNLACSGARTEHVRASASGGRAYRGEAPQVDRLAEIAATHEVELVTISVGGNDLGFTDIILDCVSGYVTSTRWFPDTCYRDQQRTVDQRLPGTLEAVAGVVADVKAVLAANGDHDARIVLLSYPSPVGPSSTNRYAETGWDRTLDGGCPFWNVDLDWASGTLVPTINGGLGAVAEESDVDFLDLSRALTGHEPCSKSVGQGVGGTSGAAAEWFRFVSTGVLQGDAEETLHPNAWGQRALGSCLRLFAATPGSGACVNTPGAGIEGMTLAG